MERQIICYIQAYDCAATIEAAMQSVLDQTYKNWLCFVLSNGNGGNGSFDVIKNFAARDSRFSVLNKRDNELSLYISMLDHLAHSFPDAYICSLDADDVYKSDFFERAISLAERYQLDIVACGTEVTLKKNTEATEETLLRRRVLEEDTIVRKKDFARQFPVYRSFFNEMWGKLYRAGLFNELQKVTQNGRILDGAFLPDSLFTLCMLSKCSAIGVLSGASHKFYQYEQRSSLNATTMVNAGAANRPDVFAFFRQRRTRNYSVYITYKIFMSFLRAYGEIHDELYEYMQAVLFGWFGDFYSRTLLLTTDEAKLASHIQHLVFNPKFDELMSYQDTGAYDNLRGFTKRKEFCERLVNLLIGQKAIKNRVSLRGKSVYCDKKTLRKIEQIIQKLEGTIDSISQTQTKHEV